MEEERLSTGRQDLILQATESLKLNDIFLFQAHMARPAPFPERSDEKKVEQHVRRGIRVIRDQRQDAKVGGKPHLQFFVVLGIRLVEPTGTARTKKKKKKKKAKHPEPKIFLEIEAEFLVEYEITNTDVSEDALKAFAEFNVIHNVWPFWRQHVFDLVQRGGLPKLEVPLFAGVKL